MRLIRAQSFLALEPACLEEFHDDDIPPYAIISHRWQGNEELSMQDLRNLAYDSALKATKGYFKIASACEQALADCLSYIWIDTCCIDKASSAELQEAINSMFRWYADAELCYACLDNPPGAGEWELLTDDMLLSADVTSRYWDAALSKCEWFTRGWTLQELLAPWKLHFYGLQYHKRRWTKVAELGDLVKTVSKMTGISADVLLHKKPLSEVCAAQRMSWAAGRKTTRIEDRAYSLLGIFGINMPLLYGEKENSFVRLQEEIIRSSGDASMLAWQPRSPLYYQDTSGRLLAPSVDNFKEAGNMTLRNEHRTTTRLELTSAGLQFYGRLVNTPDSTSKAVALGCTVPRGNTGEQNAEVCLVLREEKERVWDKDRRTYCVWHIHQRYGPFPIPRFIYICPDRLEKFERSQLLILPSKFVALFNGAPTQNDKFYLRLDTSLRIVYAEPQSLWNAHTSSVTMLESETSAMAVIQRHSQSNVTILLKITANQAQASVSKTRQAFQQWWSPAADSFARHTMTWSLRKTFCLDDELFELVWPEPESRVNAITVRQKHFAKVDEGTEVVIVGDDDIPAHRMNQGFGPV